MSNYDALKVILITLSGLSKDALHIYIALRLYLGSCLIFGWKARQWRPWLLVLSVAIIGEAWDILRAWNWRKEWTCEETGKISGTPC